MKTLQFAVLIFVMHTKKKYSLQIPIHFNSSEMKQKYGRMNHELHVKLHYVYFIIILTFLPPLPLSLLLFLYPSSSSSVLSTSSFSLSLFFYSPSQCYRFWVYAIFIHRQFIGKYKIHK